MKFVLSLPLFGLSMLLAGCVSADRSRNLADPSVSATTLAQQVCSNCHGVTGESVSPNFPMLAGQTEPYFIAQMKGFKSQGRSDPAGFEYMWGLSRALTDQQIAGLAAYYSGQNIRSTNTEGTPDRIAAGSNVYANGIEAKGIPACVGCHGDKAQGNATFPRLAGQHVDYIVKQLQVFQRTDERPDGAVMKVIAHQMSTQDMENVASFLQSLPSAQRQ
jgi:cytochrome c553